MSKTSSPIDHAFKRCSLLSRVIQFEYERARANPLDQRNVELGIFDLGEKVEKKEAQDRIEEAFSEVVALSNHLAILDMAAALEYFFRARVGTAIGEARKTLNK